MASPAEDFRAHFVEELRSHVNSDELLSIFVAELEALDCASPTDKAGEKPPSMVIEHLPRALDGLGCPAGLADAVRAVTRQIGWYQIFESTGINPALAKGMTAGQVAGKNGVVYSPTLYTGVFLLAPGIHYPLHQHAALEVYYVASGVLTLQHGRTGAPFELHPGDLSVTPSNRVHSLETGEAPCIVLYAWTGATASPNWWWEIEDDGSWHRVAWERQPDGGWAPTRREPVSDAVLREAGEI